jgi:hypothetical protein
VRNPNGDGIGQNRPPVGKSRWLVGLGVMAKVAGMQNELGRSVEWVNFCDRALERADHIAIGGPAESDVTVADLNEAELSLSSGSRTAERLRARDAACCWSRERRSPPMPYNRESPGGRFHLDRCF